MLFEILSDKDVLGEFAVVYWDKIKDVFMLNFKRELLKKKRISREDIRKMAEETVISYIDGIPLREMWQKMTDY